MGNNYSVPPIKPYKSNGRNQIFNRYGLSPSEINHLKAYFLKFAGRDGVLYPKSFRKLYASLNPHLTGDILDEKSYLAFKMIDANKDNIINFTEFVRGKF